MEAHHRDFEQLWASPDARLNRANPKDVLRGLNAWLNSNGHRTVSSRSLSNAMRREEIPDEMADLILQAEGMLA